MKKKTRAYEMTARAVKAEATRQRIRASAVELYCKGSIDDFTLDEVARRAQTTVQTILRAFGSKDELIYAALEELATRGVFVKPSQAGEVGEAVATVFEIYEGVGDFVMARLDEERRRPALKPSLDQGRDNHRDAVRILFAPQLAARRGAAREQLLTMLVVLTDVYVWKLLRRDMALSRRAAEAIVEKMITGVIERETTDGTDALAQLVGRREPAA
jgi:AcrR family transcriptional regulator